MEMTKMSIPKAAVKPPSPRVVTFTVDEATEKVLDKLKLALNKTSKAEVLRKAIALLEVATEAQSKGGSIATLDNAGEIDHRIKLI
jgi:hypothetical protein